jgi:RNA polymerase sigma-70 factor, ECF subfamily
MDDERFPPARTWSMEAVIGSERMSGPAAASATLAERAQGGDTVAFERLYRDNVSRVYALCLRLSGDGVRAEELTQDVFVRAWQKLGSFRGDSEFSTWLHRLTVNLVLGERRSEGRRLARVSPEDLSKRDVPMPAASVPGDRLDLERAIAALPPGARTVFVMHEVEGYGHTEIARLTGRAEGTCKALLHRARKLLREALA